MFEFRIFESILSILVAWKWGDWRRWKEYYATILYLIIGDLSGIILTTNKPLWKLESPITGNDFSEFLIAFICLPCTCIIFFTLYYKISKYGKMVYIPFFLFCSLIFTSIEWVAFKLGYITYHNGWSLYWSFGFDMLMFPLLLLHYKKSLWVWPISIVLAFAMIYIFHLPFSILQ